MLDLLLLGFFHRLGRDLLLLDKSLDESDSHVHSHGYLFLRVWTINLRALFLDDLDDLDDLEDLDDLLLLLRFDDFEGMGGHLHSQVGS